MEKTALGKAQEFLESYQQGAPTAGESAIAWTLVALAGNLGRIATALETLAVKGERKEGN